MKSTDDLRDEVRELARTVKALQKDLNTHSVEQQAIVGALGEQAARLSTTQAEWSTALDDRLQTISRSVADIDRRQEQLRAIATADAALERHVPALDVLLDVERIGPHVSTAIDAAPLLFEPMPHCVVDNLLPDEVYRALLRGIPSVELFSDRPVNKQQLAVPLALGPAYSRRVWSFLADAIAEQMIMPAVLRKFEKPLTEWLRQNFPSLTDHTVPMETVGGRLMLRTNGYRIRPHRDQKLGFITCLMYLAKPGDNEQWGTKLFAVEGDEEARTTGPHWIEDADRCREVKEVGFRKNRALVFLNSIGAHGAQIPADAEPAGLQRYAYQFRIGPERRTMDRLIAALPEDRRVLWGKGETSEY